MLESPVGDALASHGAALGSSLPESRFDDRGEPGRCGPASDGMTKAAGPPAGLRPLVSAGSHRAIRDGVVTQADRPSRRPRYWATKGPWLGVLAVASAAVWLCVVGLRSLAAGGDVWQALATDRNQMVGPALVAVVSRHLSCRASLAGGPASVVGPCPPGRRGVPCSFCCRCRSVRHTGEYRLRSRDGSICALLGVGTIGSVAARRCRRS